MRRTVPILTLLVLAGGMAFAQSPRSDSAALAQAQAEARMAAERSDRLDKEARRSVTEAERARVEAEALAAGIEAAEAELTAAERRIAIIARLRSEHQARLAERQKPLVQLTGALQVMARRPAALALVQPGSMEELVRVRSLLDATLPEIRRRTVALRAELERSDQLRDQAQRARDALLASRSTLQARRSELARLEASQRTRSLELAGLALTESDRALAFTEEARALTRLIGTREAQAQRAEELAQLPEPLPRPGNPGENADEGPTLAYTLPVRGRVVTGVGEISDGGVHARGLTLATASGARVRSPANGRVLHAAPFGRYDYVVILDHGGGWLTVITDLATARVSAGQAVRRGDLLGLAGDGEPQVTIELRRDGRPVPLAQIVSV